MWNFEGETSCNLEVFNFSIVFAQLFHYTIVSQVNETNTLLIIVFISQSSFSFVELSDFDMKLYELQIFTLSNLCDFHEFSNWRGLTLTDSWELDDLLECCDTSSNRRMTHTTRAGSIHPSHRQWLGGNLVMIFTTEIEGESKEGWHDGGERIFDNFYCYSFPLHDDEYIFLVSQLSLSVSLTMWCM